MGLKSGEYGGKNNSFTLCLRAKFQSFFLRWKEALSIIIVEPLETDLTNLVLNQFSKKSPVVFWV
jgi:hypothetical protein